MNRFPKLKNLKKKNSTKDISNYYMFDKSNFKKYGLVGLTICSLYFLNHKFRILERIKNKFFVTPIMEILNSKEVKGASVNLVEDLFKDKTVLKTIVITLKQSIREKEYVDPLKVFIKIWVLKVLKHQEFLKVTKRSVIDMLKSKEVTDETIVLLKYIAESPATKECIAQFFKTLFLSDELFPNLCELLEKSTLRAIKSDRNKAQAGSFVYDLLSDKKLRYYLYYKTLTISK